MKPELLLFAVGGLLLVTGLLGGGFELRELKVPRVGRVARVLATAVGAVCMLLGLGVTNLDNPRRGPDPATAAQISANTATGPVHFTVHDDLGDTQVSEQVSVIVDGRHVGDLTINGDFPTSNLDISVDQPGRHDYTLGASSEELAADGSVVERDGTGQGTIMVEAGESFHVEYADSGDTRNLALVAD